MTDVQIIIMIAVIAVATAMTRFLPFIIFPSGKMPKFMQYLGRVLPAAVFGMLLVYCLRNVDLLGASHGIPELIAIALVVVLYLWKKQMLLSVAAGTISYMLLVQLVF